MSEVKWTESQQSAISYHKSSVIVSAAAGSGKTAVLVERIIRMLENTDIDRLLVVTFTQAAASQMRESIAEALEKKIRSDISDKEKQLYHRQLLLLPGANISTMHSFCSKIIKDNFDKLELSPDYSLAEPDRSNLLLSQCVEQLIDGEYDAGSKEFLEFAGNYTSYKNDQAISSMLLSLYNFSRSVPYPNMWFDNIIKTYENPTIGGWIEDFYNKTRHCLISAKKMCNDLLTYLSAENEKEITEKHLIPLISGDFIAINSCLEEAHNFSSIYELVNNIKFKNFPALKDAKTHPAVLYTRQKRDAVKDFIADVKKQYLRFSIDEIIEFSALQLPHIKELVRLTKKLDELYSSKKRSLNLLDFNDLEHMAIKLLTDEHGNPTNCAMQLSEEFDEIIVDEYQDTNDVQEAILNAVSNKKSNIFMVGDMKQSIYRFRNTAPEIFLSKTESYSDSDCDTGKRIFLSSNFRSRKNILDFSNLIFEQIMSKELGEIEYGENEALHYGASYEETDPPIDITVIEKNEYTDFSAIEQESAVIANKINSLITSGFKVTDKKTKKMRPVTYKDFVILLRNTKNVSDEMAAFLTECGIPVYNDGGKELLLSSVEVQTVISFLKIIDNPYNDIPLIAVLRSPLYKFDDDLLMEITKSGEKNTAFFEKLKNFEHEKISAFISDLEYYKKQASILSVYELTDLVIQKNMLMEFSATMPGGSQRILNLRYLLRLADNYVKNSSGGLFGFLVYVDSFSNHSQGMTSPKILPDTSDVVTITTMHKSKGLEYPVVIIPRLGKAMRNLDLSSKVLIHKNIGIGFDYIDAENHTKIPSPIRAVISGKTTDEHLSEELRVLYVALTRAKEKLILIGSVDSHEKMLENLSNALYEQSYKFPPHIAKSANSYLLWILLAISRHKSFEKILESNGYDINTLTDLSSIDLKLINNVEFSAYKNTNQIVDFDFCDISDAVRQKLEYRVPDVGQGVFSKYSVSELKRYIENETDHKDYFEKLVNVSNLSNSAKVTSSQRGSAIHKVFELIDINGVSSENDIKSFTELLVKKEILTAEESILIPCDKIWNFFLSEIGQRLKKAEYYKREVPFNIHISEDFKARIESNLKVQLQGVIDCYFKDSYGYTIIDFKSDKITNENKESKIENYKKQLEFYTMALKAMKKDASVKACIYFLDDNTTVWL